MAKSKKKKQKQKAAKETELKKKNTKKKKEAKKSKPEKKAAKPQKKIEVTEVYESLSRLVNLINRMSTEPIMYRGNSYHPAEMKALDAIQKNQPISTTELANELHVTRSAVLKTINKLFHKGVIDKKKSQTNRRVVEFSLSQTGEDFLNETENPTVQLQQPVMDALDKMTSTELAYFNDGLERILINLIH